MHTNHLRRCLRATVFAVLAILAAGSFARAADVKPSVSADEVLKLLTTGNERFTAGKPEHPNTDLDRVHSTGKNGQTPFATILSCADSRVPVETVFDRGVGDLFVVRVAGNVADPGTLGSIEYAAEHLGTPLIVVMGHTQCGAVKAAVDGGELSGNLPSLIDRIKPAVAKTREHDPALKGKELLAAAVAQNVREQIDAATSKSALLKRFVAEGKVKIVGAVYDIETGKVEWLDQK